MTRRRQQGFTLLEVMVALAILALSLTVLSQAETNSVRAVGRAKQMTIATMLARTKMVEIEDKLFEQGFSEFEEEDKGDFDDEGFKQFSFTQQVDKVELPAEINADSLTGALSGADGQGDGATADAPGGGGILAVGARMMSAQFEIFRNTLEQSIRRVSLRVSWKEGTRERYITVVAYFVDPRKIDAVAGGGISLDQLVGGSETP